VILTHPLADLLLQTITLERRTGLDQYGAHTYGTAESLAARVVNRLRMVRNVAGQEVTSNTTIWIIGNNDIKAVDRITLPDGTQPPIIDVLTYPDETGVTHHQEVLL